MRHREDKEKKESESVPASDINIYLYYANVMDYFRVVLAMFAFYIAKTCPITFVIIFYFVYFRRL